MNKHTPGPWAFAKYSNKQFGLGKQGEGAFFFLQCVHDTANDPEAIADARLISAAPDLLEALRGLISVFSSNSTEQEIISAREAIAKATGEKA